MIAETQLTEWLALAEGIAPAPWDYSKRTAYVRDVDTKLVADVFGDANGRFIAAARASVPALIAELREARRLVELALEFDAAKDATAVLMTAAGDAYTEEQSVAILSRRNKADCEFWAAVRALARAREARDG